MNNLSDKYEVKEIVSDWTVRKQKSAQDMLEKISNYYPKRVTLDDVYIFTVKLCDNDIDTERDCFSDESLKDIERLAIGKTGQIYDYKARIFDTRIIVDDDEKTKYGEPRKELYAHCWIERTPQNAEIIQAIADSVTNIATISCSVKHIYCSVCGNNKLRNHCKCDYGYDILDGVNDVYSWFFEPLVIKECVFKCQK